MKRKLLDEVSVNELLEFRAEGYTNAQIAELLDVCERTIYRIIGKMPDEMIKKAKKEGQQKGVCARMYKKQPSEGNKQMKGAEQKMENTNSACLVVVNRKETLQGTIGLYEVDCEKKKVTMRPVEEINFENLNDYINELQAISRKIAQMNVGNEMW